MQTYEDYEFKDFLQKTTKEFLSDVAKKSNAAFITTKQRDSVQDFMDIISTDTLSDLMYELQDVDRGEE